MIAANDIATLNRSSAVLATGAPAPAVLTLMNGLAAAFMLCTMKEMTMPATIGTHWLLEKKSPGLDTVTVDELDAAPKARPPAVGRTTVCTRSLMWSTTGILSATNSIASSSPRIASTQPFSSQDHEL